MSDLQDVVTAVRSQYEDLPYPHREPNDERKRLIRPYGVPLDEVNHFCFSGKEGFDDIRVLVAGGGTGDRVLWQA